MIAGIVLGIGRAIGDNGCHHDRRKPGAAYDEYAGWHPYLTGNIVIEMGYATGLHREALIATGVVLFVFILIINLSVALLKRGRIMSNEVSRSNQMINKTTIGDKFKTYLKHPGSFILMLLVMLAALVTFAVLIF